MKFAGCCFADLKDEYGQWIGDALECEHYDTEGNAYQKTTRGLLYYEKRINQAGFVPNSWLIPGSANLIPTAEEFIERYSISALRANTYGQEGDIQIVRRMERTSPSSLVSSTHAPNAIGSTSPK